MAKRLTSKDKEIKKRGTSVFQSDEICYSVSTLNEGLDLAVVGLFENVAKGPKKEVLNVVRQIREFSKGVLEIIDNVSAGTSEVEPEYLEEICDDVDEKIETLKQSLGAENAWYMNVIRVDIETRVLESLKGEDEIGAVNVMKPIEELPGIPKNNQSEICNQVENLRKNFFGMSVKDFALKVAISKDELEKFENNKCGKNFRKYVKQVMLNTGVSFDYLIGGGMSFNFSPFRPASQKIADVLASLNVDEKKHREQYWQLVEDLTLDPDQLRGGDKDYRDFFENRGLDLEALKKKVESVKKKR